MKPENLQFLEDNRSLWTTLRDAQYLRFPHQGIKDGLVRIMREEFRPGYTCDLWCNHCVATMVREVYTAFEQWEEKERVSKIREGADRAAEAGLYPDIEPTPAEFQGFIKTNEEPLPPIPVKAAFPSHKKHHRR